ncbi:hypothetical protein COEREDRAFT_83919 [Coemansia reversa NRRL 1564]|uniref:CUE domain-containing protein n=1 Tax=Coemansia reversa (strain ATCC 12441 / NRRL 1564) TaxID=763665 RepID=A0A2G5B239_COERN|nr:hypothetical protein COEREDRAFT_83919 [Coemansia reversa NRRL 1564]|eukprot:PIA12777.1 hypothetical protein COEREDRAFT_83919 [Coemansia reversa NRRL 1564]
MAATGMRGAPTVKLWMMSLFCFGVVLAISPSWRQQLLRLRVYPYITRRWEFWRLATTLVGFPTITETLMALVLLYQLRIIERLFGTHKFVAFLFVSSVVGQVLSVIMVLTARFLSQRAFALVNTVAGGPYATIFACLYQFYAHVPAKQHVRVLGVVTVSDKWMAYVVAGNLTVARLPATLLPAVAGIAASLVYSANVAGLRLWRFPNPLADFTHRWVQPRLTSVPRRRQPALSSHAVPRPQTVVSEAVVAQLQAMFPATAHERIAQALAATGGDVDRAVSTLLNSSP